MSFVIGDLADTESLVRACRGVEVVFHVAALARDWGPRKTFFEVNFDGTKNLLDACVQNKVSRFVFMSSGAVYGFPKAQQPLSEKYRKNPTAKYGESKLCAEELIWRYGKQYNIRVSALRSPIVIGPRDRLISLFLIQALQQRRFFYIGDGNQMISVSDARDVACCLRLAGESEKADGQAYNVKSFDTTPRQLIETVVERLQLPIPQTQRSYLSAYVLASLVEGMCRLRRKENPPVTRHKIKVMGTHRPLDITKAIQELNYLPHYSFATTINDTISWYLTLTQGGDKVYL